MQTTRHPRQQHFPVEMYVHIQFPNLFYAPSTNFVSHLGSPPFFLNIFSSATEKFFKEGDR